MIVVSRTKGPLNGDRKLSLPPLIRNLKISRSTKGENTSLCHLVCHLGLTGEGGNRTGINLAESTFTGGPLAVSA